MICAIIALPWRFGFILNLGYGFRDFQVLTYPVEAITLRVIVIAIALAVIVSLQCTENSKASRVNYVSADVSQRRYCTNHHLAGADAGKQLLCRSGSRVRISDAPCTSSHFLKPPPSCFLPLSPSFLSPWENQIRKRHALQSIILLDNVSNLRIWRLFPPEEYNELIF